MTGPRAGAEGVLDPARPAPEAVAAERADLVHACAAPAPSADVAGTPASTGAGAGAGAGSRPRLVGIDTARGLALLGMMSVHLFAARAPGGDVSLAWQLSSGKASALFALLAGVGVAFLTGRARVTDRRSWGAHAASLAVRALLIGAVGLALGYLVAGEDAAVILPYYALLFVLAIPLLPLSVRALVWTAAALGLAGPVLSHLLRSGGALTEEPNPTFTDLVQNPLALLRDLTLTGVFPALPWLAYLCVGLAVGRAVLGSRRTVATLTVIGAGLAATATTVSWLLLDVVGGRDDLRSAATQSLSAREVDALLVLGPTGSNPTDSWWWLATMSPHSGTPLDLAFTTGIALTVLGVCILVGRITTVFLRPLAAAGSMTLTLYSLHLVLLSWPALPGGGSEFLIQTALLIAFALLWSRTHARGPLEEIVAAATGAARRTVQSARRGERPAGSPGSGRHAA